MCKRKPAPTRAIVYIPAELSSPDRFAEAAAPCLERVEACGYQFDGIVRSWADVERMIDAHQLHVLIVENMSHLPVNREPRIETAFDPVQPPCPDEPPAPLEQPPAAARGWRRRPRRLR